MFATWPIVFTPMQMKVNQFECSTELATCQLKRGWKVSSWNGINGRSIVDQCKRGWSAVGRWELKGLVRLIRRAFSSNIDGRLRTSTAFMKEIIPHLRSQKTIVPNLSNRKVKNKRQYENAGERSHDVTGKRQIEMLDGWRMDYILIARKGTENKNWINNQGRGDLTFHSRHLFAERYRFWKYQITLIRKSNFDILRVAICWAVFGSSLIRMHKLRTRDGERSEKRRWYHHEARSRPPDNDWRSATSILSLQRINHSCVRSL